MTKDDLLTLVKEGKDQAEAFYVQNGPNKHEQEDHYSTGVSVVQMNITLLMDWLSSDQPEPLEDWEALSKADRREIWEASDFHFGIMGYDDPDADFWWEHEAYEN